MKSCDNHCHFLTTSGARFFFFILLLQACNPSPEVRYSPVTHPEIKGEAISFLGDTLQRPEMNELVFHQHDSLLRESYAMYLEDSTALNNIIWYGRRLAYMHRYKDAIDLFTLGLRYFPNAPELYRHRGHRFITLRRLVDAIADLERGVTLAQNRKMEIEADGIPNKLNIPLSNLHFNLYYHLGLAYFLHADYPRAIEAFLGCKKYADNPDLMVATTDWLYLSYLRAGDRSSAEKCLTGIHADMEIIENAGYLERLLIYKGEREPGTLTTDPTIYPVAFATKLYGISCWYEMRDQPAEAASIRRMILSSSSWPAFGYIAAEADSSRLTPH